METTEKAIDVLHDLERINNDRVAGFENASENLENDDLGLRPVFNRLAGESRDYAAELANIAREFTDEADEGTSVPGTLHRAWIDVKATFTGHDLESLLAECERGEDAIKSAYKSALEDENELPYEIVQVIRRQQEGIIKGHNLIKSLRDKSKGTDGPGESGTIENKGTLDAGIAENHVNYQAAGEQKEKGLFS